MNCPGCQMMLPKHTSACTWSPAYMREAQIRGLANDPPARAKAWADAMLKHGRAAEVDAMRESVRAFKAGETIANQGKLL